MNLYGAMPVVSEAVKLAWLGGYTVMYLTFVFMLVPNRPDIDRVTVYRPGVE